MPERPNLFQFWDMPTPPEEVETLMATWKDEPGFRYRRFDAARGRAYIAKRYEPRVVAAYSACAVPAMRADLFRYCALHAEGGAYVEAHSRASGRLAEFVGGEGRGVLMIRAVRIANDFLFVRGAGDPLFRAVIDIAVDNIERRISNNVWAVTGPGIMTTLHRDPATANMFEGFRIEPVEVVRQTVVFQAKMDYKLTEADWRASLNDGAVSIYSDAG